ncbi:YolD-like protein [Bacillus sp. OV166]|uniref:YolD-like family protein n=1 Tax=Bacillus sp. OV166 TaxID=1882763 RepID=UPI000A2AA6E5|nr:YolD-like family protein [Bacillus sp. OV166]SMQ72166.1 YolD-like protein [Bacillus sp. OV166]
MTIKDRGLIKWNAASFMPQVFEQQREMFKDQERQPWPLLSEFDTEEFDQRIDYAIEFKLAVRLTVWEDGFTTEMTGHIHHVDPITISYALNLKTESLSGWRSIVLSELRSLIDCFASP